MVHCTLLGVGKKAVSQGNSALQHSSPLTSKQLPRLRRRLLSGAHQVGHSVLPCCDVRDAEQGAAQPLAKAAAPRGRDAVVHRCKERANHAPLGILQHLNNSGQHSG